CCGRMGPMCIPVYDIVQNLESEYPHIQMRDRDFDIPSASYIRNLPECALFTGLPFTIYSKNDRVVKATSGIRDENQIRIILDDIFKG
ncbi:MAG: thioredoxin, partial [Candidatus Omnitrophica bacterium]|nr:thioredoxin [Candidatus Omnitrophota bacterium]